MNESKIKQILGVKYWFTSVQHEPRVERFVIIYNDDKLDMEIIDVTDIDIEPILMEKIKKTPYGKRKEKLIKLKNYE